MKKRLYRGNGTRRKEVRSFEKRYGKQKGKYVYGATVGKVYREKYGHSYRGGSHCSEQSTTCKTNKKHRTW